MLLPVLSGQWAGLAMLVGAATAGYVASRAAAHALISGDQQAPGRRAFIHAMMTGVVAVAAVVRNPMLRDVAVGVPFSASVAALTLGLGVVLFVAVPLKSGRTPETSPLAARKRLWAFLLPTALLTVFMGFTAQVTGQHAVVLVVEGLTLLILWSGTSPTTPTNPDRQPESSGWIVQLLLALFLAGVSGLAAVDAAAGLAASSPIFRPGVAAALALGPAVVLPMVPPLATLAEHGRRDEAISAIVAFVLVNLCGVLPAVVAVKTFKNLLSPVQLASTTQPSVALDSLPFPMTVWRLDAMILMVVGIFLLPAALGRTNPSRAEGLALIGGYVAYLFVTLLISHGG